MPFRRTIPIRLRHTDAAGVLFFAEQLVLVHEAYEDLMDEMGHSLRSIFKTNEFAFPILHVETDFRLPVQIGDRVEVELSIERIGTTSFTLAHRLLRSDQLVGQGKTVHGCIAPQSKTKTQLPAPLVSALQTYLERADEEAS